MAKKVRTSKAWAIITKRGLLPSFFQTKEEALAKMSAGDSLARVGLEINIIEVWRLGENKRKII